MSSRRNSYTANFNLQVVAFAETTNNSIAARLFSVNEKQVRKWQKKQNILCEMPKGKKALYHYCLDLTYEFTSLTFRIRN